MPGYTHLQRAQPVLLAHHLLAHGWALARDNDRLFATWKRLDVSPLGAGALAGSSLGIDPDLVAGELGFHGRFENSLDAVSDRDFVAEILFDLALIAIHLSRIGEEIVVFSSEEFGFVRLDDAWATGSSMLPQKKNPDVAELARGKAGRLVGHLAGFLTTLKGLPLSYNRDLQEDKEPLFDALDQVVLALAGLDGLLATASFDLDRMQDAAGGAGLAAVDLAEWLVAAGMPFRDAHGLVGTLVRESIERGVPLAELVEAHPDFGEQALEVLDAAAALRRRTTPGGTGPDAVAVQHERFRKRLAADAGPARRAGGVSAAARRPCRRGLIGRGASFAEPPGGRSGPGGAAASRQAPAARAASREDRRGGGLPGVPRRRLARVPGPDARETPRCSGHQGISTCTSPTGCTFAPTSSAGRRARRERCCSAPSRL